jgi:NADH-quinone oxidoreductase subunit L
LGGFGIHWFAEWTRNETFVEARIPEYPFSFSAAGISLAVALFGAAIGFLYYERHLLARFHELAERNRYAHIGKTFLLNKYYLDALYTDGVIGSIKGPIARAAYWVNQNVIDGIVNAVGIGAKRTGEWVYKWIDQGVVDGTVNGLGLSASESGGGLRSVIQTGRVQWYGSILFGAVGLLALALVIFV